MKKTALITGVTGQDGSYLSELLLNKGYDVHGIIRRSSTLNTERVDHLFKDIHEKNNSFHLHYGDLTDSGCISDIIRRIMPDEVYNLGAQSHVRISFDMPEYTSNVVALGPLRILESIKNFCKDARYYQASSSEMFGKVVEIPQNEETPFYPRSPYGCSKTFGYWITKNYRESYGLHASNGILFNHESERRGINFVTKKVSRGLSRIKLGLDDKLYLGNLDAKRDWGHAKDFVKAMWLILQQERPDDYVIATGETHTVREFIERGAKLLDINLSWSGNGIHEIGLNLDNGKTIIEIDQRYFRPSEVDLLVGDPKKAKKVLGWEPEIKFEELVKIMVENDLEYEKRFMKKD
ncbi:MAG TPA: GDP-mannose 4,6-dehydratase [Candidatus Paceibacterota bacterium]|nr:GDP-mannose 4,6-dehydratase [Candidatus Paceibacterota bacterium]